MNKPVRTATADLYLSYGQFVIRDYSPDYPTPDLAYPHGLVGADFRGTSVLTGIDTGWVTVTLQVLDSEPDSVELDDWDEVAEVSVDSEDGELFVHALGEDSPPEFPGLAHEGPGTYRLRVHARGRDIGPPFSRRRTRRELPDLRVAGRGNTGDRPQTVGQARTGIPDLAADTVTRSCAD